MPIKIKKNSKRVTIIIIVAFLLLSTAAAGLFFYLQPKRIAVTHTESARPVNHINYDGPTDEEQAAGDQQKEDNIKRDETPSQPSSHATVVIADASQYGSVIEVRGYVSSVIEDGGQCSATFTHGATSFTVSGSATKDAKTTQCSPLSAQRSQFLVAGSWSVVLTYTSSSTTGASSSYSLEIT
jgi:hypothetical protein